MSKIDAALIMGSDSDFPHVESALKVFEEFGVKCEVRVISAHRTPEELERYIPDAEKRGAGVFLAAAGGAAHLPGVIAAKTVLPVLGIPILTKAFKGVDSSLSILQMPGGVPVATMPVGSAGPKNAALFAVEVLSLRDPSLAEKLRAHRKTQAQQVAAKDKALREKLGG
ncbi:MAG: 5-(carboxyamino)imidazole ribonucleotide mutase [Planctomycetota bacterium]|jgi:5-(carboxyamino)imidazole ribonucleotide mutase